MTDFLLKTVLPDTEIVSVTEITNGTLTEPDSDSVIGSLPRFYRVELLSRPGVRSHIRSEVWLPLGDAWNGRLLGFGNGGIGGRLYLGGMAPYLREGYVCTHTDLGTSGGMLCGYENPDVRADYGWRATHIMTVCAKELSRALYGKEPEYSYFRGNSTGGMQGYSEAQRYPDDYDGILAGVPSIINTAYHTDYLWNYVHLHTAEHRPLFTHEEFVRLAAFASAFASMHGGGEPGDAFVSAPWSKEITTDGFIDYLKEQSDFSEEQVRGLRAVYEGPFDEKRNRRLCCGLPLGCELSMEAFSGDGCPGIYLFVWAFGEDFDPWSFDFSDDFAEFSARLAQYINAVDTDLSLFSEHGGKLLAFAGTADPIVPHPETDLYYEKAAEKAGGFEKCAAFFRYFLLPGRAHEGGAGADTLCSADDEHLSALDTLVRWREEGIAPDAMTAVSSWADEKIGKTKWKRTIYPYGNENLPFHFHKK